MSHLYRPTVVNTVSGHRSSCYANFNENPKYEIHENPCDGSHAACVLCRCAKKEILYVFL